MDKNLVAQSLKFCKLFKSFNDEAIYSLLNSKEVFLRSYNSEDMIFMEGTECNVLSIVIDGVIEIVKLDSDGNVLIVSTLEKGNVFGENLLFGDMHFYPMSVICKTQAKVLHIRKNHLASLLQDNHEFLLIFLRILSNKAMALSSKLKQISMKSLRQMIIDYILDIYSREKSLTIPLNMSKKEWADKLGVQRPSLSRELINMKKDGLIDYDRKNIIILDLETLELYK